MLTLNDGRSELWQWDTGRKLTVDADCSQVHFSNKIFGRSIDVDVVDGVAIIPDVLLQTDKDLFAWAFVGTPENGYTKISKVFKVNRRNKPSDYVFTPPEQTTLGEILERIDDLESVKVPDAIKNAVEDYLEQNPVEVPVQSVNGQTGEVKLTADDVGAISQDKLQDATNVALAQAKASGEFDGKDGYTPRKGVDYFDGKDGKDGYTPVKGVDYWTPDDKQEIVNEFGAVSYNEQTLTEAQKAQARANIGAQPVGEYLTEVPEGYAKNEDIKKVDRKVDTLREVVSKFHSNIQETAKGEVITVSDASDLPLAGLKVFGKTEQNGTPTPDAPVPLESVGDSVTVTVCGKNLANVPRKAVADHFGLKWVAEGSVFTFSGTITKDYGDIITSKTIRLEPGSYTVSFKNLEKIKRIEFCCESEDGTKVFNSQWLTARNPTYTFTVTQYCYVKVVFVVDKGSVFGDDTNPTSIYMQLEKGATATDYEPYKDGGTLTAQTPNGLPGIPVSSGGNYTDSTGQQWICDEVDFEKGVYVQRVWKQTFTQNNNYHMQQDMIVRGYTAKISIEGGAVICTHLPSNGMTNRFYSVAMGWNGQQICFCNFTTVDDFKAVLGDGGMEVLYELATPIETDLTAEEIAQYSALHTNYPNTTVYNDAGAGMGVKYVADTKLYIDNKFAELASAIVNN